jgi:hypothetical protein
VRPPGHRDLSALADGQQPDGLEVGDPGLRPGRRGVRLGAHMKCKAAACSESYSAVIDRRLAQRPRPSAHPDTSGRGLRLRRFPEPPPQEVVPVLGFGVLAVAAVSQHASGSAQVLSPQVQATSESLGDGAWTLDPPPAGAQPPITSDQAVQVVEGRYLQASQYVLQPKLVLFTSQEHPVNGSLTYDHLLAWMVVIEGYPACGGPMGGGACQPGTAVAIVDATSGDFIESLEYGPGAVPQLPSERRFLCWPVLRRS